MTGWWAQRTTREQALLAIAAALFALAGLWSFVVAPIAEWRGAAGARADHARSEYSLVARAAGMANVDEADKETGAAPVRGAVIETARRLGVELIFVNAASDGAVEVQSAPVAPERVFQFFSELQARHGVRVASADIARSAEDKGEVRFQASVTR